MVSSGDQSAEQPSNPVPENGEPVPLPRYLSGRMGTRQYTIAALIERITAAFEQEHGTESPALAAATTYNDRLKLLRDTVTYVIAVESVQISPEVHAEITRLAYSEIFGYGPLDAFLADAQVTTVALDGIDKASVRYGHGDFAVIEHPFEDPHHMRRVVAKLVQAAGGEMDSEHPYLEIGLTVNGRRVGLNLVMPPVTPHLTVDMRLHPRALPPLEARVEDAQARRLLEAIATSAHGFVVVGESESGKTTLLSMMLAAMVTRGASAESIVTVERAGELHLPAGARRFQVRWPAADQPGATFAEQVRAALEAQPHTVVLDEVRADEPQAVTPLLTADPSPRQMWAFRGPADSKRLASALGMVARRGDPTQSEALVLALYRRLPFVIVVRRRKERLQLHSIGEWQFSPGVAYPDYVELMAQGWEGLELSGKRSALPLDLEDAFWH